MSRQELTATLMTAIQTALADPITADLHQLLQEFEQVLGTLPQTTQLQVAGEIFAQLAELCAARATHLLEAWEARHNPDQSEPVLTAAMLQEVLRQSMSLNLTGLLEDPDRQRCSIQTLVPIESKVGEVEKAELLDFLDAVEAAEAKAEALHVAHDEDVSLWAATISQWLATHTGQTISLLELQRALQMPLVTVWLTLLLGGYGIEQRGEFYQTETVWVQANR